ncbi:hypothetical protein QBE52_02675 [Clostridiaceae bacterium 35-E11]
MNRNKFKVIKGNKPQPTNTKTKLHFIEAYVTNTRLMGVVGLRIVWTTEELGKIHQFFHLDAEEYGLDDYKSVVGDVPHKIESITAKMMGGLGGKLIPINEQEARYLLQSFVKKNKAFKEPMPEPQWEYDFLIKETVTLCDEAIAKLWDKICEPIASPIHLVNYFIMRSVGKDEEALSYLSVDNSMDYQPVKNPSTLLKNVVEIIHDQDSISYIAESIVDADHHYKMILSEIKVAQTERGLKVAQVEIKSTMRITSTEAAFALTRKEYLSVYEVKDHEAFIDLLDREKPHAMKHDYEGGCLYTEFKPTNDHVKESIYYLNEDVCGVYYITISDQLVVAGYSKEKIERHVKYFESPIFQALLKPKARITLDNPVLYEFVHSDYEDIFEFLEDEKM